MNEFALIVLSRYKDVFDGFRANIEKVEPERDMDKLLIMDGYEIEYAADDMWDWGMNRGIEPFVFARNVNFAWMQCRPTSDILLCGDDVRFETPFVDALRALAYSDPKIGVAVPQMYGQSPFVAGYFKREVIDKVGPMDEQFDGYGLDDMDWCKRMEQAGYRTQPTEEVKAKHTGGTSFYRREKETGQSVGRSNEAMWKLFNEKWGL